MLGALGLIFKARCLLLEAQGFNYSILNSDLAFRISPLGSTSDHWSFVLWRSALDTEWLSLPNLVQPCTLCLRLRVLTSLLPTFGARRPTLDFSAVNQHVHEQDGSEGVDTYVIDTGIDVHNERSGDHAVWDSTVPRNNIDEDGNGHGTRCAGTITRIEYGVTNTAVMVLGANGSGSTSDVTAGVLWAGKAAQANAIKNIEGLHAIGTALHKNSIADMSPALDSAVDTAVKSGMPFTVAAENDNMNAYNFSTVAVERAITVGAGTLGSGRAFASSQDLYADVVTPGRKVFSTWFGSKTPTNIVQGTSMASPDTADLLAHLFLIHGAEAFNFGFGKSVRALTTNPNVNDAITAVLPRWMSTFVPSRFINAADDVLLGDDNLSDYIHTSS